MNSQIWDRHIDIAPLSAELAAVVSEFNACALRMANAQSFFRAHNGAVLALRDTDGVETADRQRQVQVRCTNQSGRLALFVALNQLSRARLSMAKQVTKIVTTMPHIADDQDRKVIGLAAFTAARDGEQRYLELSRAYEQQDDCDPTVEKGPAALKAAFGLLVKEGVNSQALEGANPPLTHLMVLIPIKNADVDEGRLVGADINEEVVSVGNSALAFPYSEPCQMSRNQYFLSKARLDEPTYARRLLAASASGTAAVGVLKNAQSLARTGFLAHRTAVTTATQQIEATADRLSGLVGRLCESIPSNGKDVPVLKMVAMNNALAADAIVRVLRAIVANWNAELLATAEQAAIAETSLCDELATVFSQEPFNQLRWVFGVDGRYIDLSRHAKR